MKTKEEIEHLAVDIIKTRFNETSGYHKVVYVEAYVRAYMQCQEDMADKKYTKEDVINIVNKSRETGLTAEYLILSLNKQD